VSTPPPSHEIETVPRYAVYGIVLETDFVFRWPLPLTDAAPDLRFDCVGAAPIADGWDARPPVHGVVVYGDDNDPDIAYHVLDDLDVVRIPGVADHFVWPDRIVCQLHGEGWEYLAEVQLLGMVLALWLERRGLPTLHASAAVVDGRAVAFLGTKGGGKTTAAAALVAAGHPMLADDLLAIWNATDQPRVAAGYPMLRLWPEQADHFVGHHVTLPLVHPAYTKRRVLIGSQFGRFHGDQAPLERIYLPQRRRGGEVEIAPVRPRDALLATVRDSFLRDAVHGLGLAGPRLERLAATLLHVPVRTLRYPTGFERLPELVAAVEADLRTS
jgi:hypothetical protein